MRQLAEIYRIAVIIAAAIFIVVGAFSVTPLTDYTSRNDVQGYIMISVAVIGLLLLGPSAILLAIMDDIRAIRERESLKEVERETSQPAEEKVLNPSKRPNSNREKLEPKF